MKSPSVADCSEEKISRRSFLLALSGGLSAAALTLMLAGCGGGGGGGGNSPATTVTAAKFSVTAPATATSGTAFSITVKALDASGNVVTGYAGTVHFTSTNTNAALPADKRGKPAIR